VEHLPFHPESGKTREAFHNNPLESIMQENIDLHLKEWRDKLEEMRGYL